MGTVNSSRPRWASERAVAISVVGIGALVVAVFFFSLALASRNDESSTDRRLATRAIASGVTATYLPPFRPGHEHAPRAMNPRLSRRVTFCPILTYHYIRNYTNPYDVLGQRLSVAPSVFASEMRFIRYHGFHTVTMLQLADHIRYGTPLPRHPVALTFDDGYRDHFTSALPILRRYGLKATFFIVSGFVGTPRYMNWAQIRTLDRDGMEIGVHTIHHLDLTTLTASQLWQEVYQSKRQIEKHIGRPAVVFAYPSGAFDSLVLDDVRRTGYLAAVSTLPGTLHAQSTIDYLFRVEILNSDTTTTLDGYLTTGFGYPFQSTPTVP